MHPLSRIRRRTRALHRSPTAILSHRVGSADLPLHRCTRRRPDPHRLIHSHDRWPPHRQQPAGTTAGTNRPAPPVGRHPRRRRHLPHLPQRVPVHTRPARTTKAAARRSASSFFPSWPSRHSKLAGRPSTRAPTMRPIDSTKPVTPPRPRQTTRTGRKRPRLPCLPTDRQRQAGSRRDRRAILPRRRHRRARRRTGTLTRAPGVGARRQRRRTGNRTSPGNRPNSPVRAGPDRNNPTGQPGSTTTNFRS